MGYSDRLEISLADESARNDIYAMRHQVYAAELGQHPENSAGILTDKLDEFNHYIVARNSGGMVGFISITPPSHNGYSVDKYISRAECPFVFDDELYEIRLLTVSQQFRGTPVALLLMYAAFRWVQSRGGKRLVAIGRKEVLDLYERVGLMLLGHRFQSGTVTYELMTATVAELQAKVADINPLLTKYIERIDWKLAVPFRAATGCYHGGASFKAIGEDFGALERRQEVINADVLDAWFEPSPKVIEAMRNHLPWILKTSPPTQCEGLIRAIAEARGIEPGNILCGAGSSDLMYRVLPRCISSASRVLLMDPAYGEYRHLLEQVVQCHVDYLALDRRQNYKLSLDRLADKTRQEYDWLVLVNPNNPTGQLISRSELEAFLKRVPKSTRVWVDEAYIEYAGSDQSLERFAAAQDNVVVCKSMSKGYALSGMRVAYLCAHPSMIADLRAITPPWVVSLPGQIAAVQALKDPDYYAACYAKTRELGKQLDLGLQKLGLSTHPGVANYVLAHLPAGGPDADHFIRRCRKQNLFIRNASPMGQSLGDYVIRIAVKDEPTIGRMLAIMGPLLI